MSEVSESRLKAVRRIEIRTNRLVSEGMGGEYHSVFKGRGMEFSEVREYVPGDDIRTIDWNVTARTGDPFVKRFVEERELTLMLLVDVSGSGVFGSGERSKTELAAEVSAVLAFAAIRNNDRVGAILFTDKVERYIPPRRGRRHVLAVVRDLLWHRPDSKGTDIAGALNFLSRIAVKRAIVFLISDFRAAGYEKALRLAHRKHDVIAIHVRDPREETLPPVGLLSLEDAETGARRLVDASSPRVREAWAAREVDRRRRLARQLRTAGIDSIELETSKPYDRPLLAFFRARERRLR
jgi:uncharacterized protein (DUF58 family)